jgi:hypothetical protein
MSIFYEKKHVLWLLNGGKKDKRVYQHELNLIACYLRNTLGKNREQVKQDLLNFCKDNDKSFNEIMGKESIDRALKKSEYRILRKIETISVTKQEIEAIYESFDNYKRQKAIFTMIVLAKFYHDKSHYKNYKKRDGYEDWYVLYNKMSQILSLAGVHASKSERLSIIHEIHQSGLATYAIGKKSKGYFKINCIESDGNDNFIVVEDLDNIGDFFPYFCVNCGNQYEWTPYSKNQLCDKCYEEKLRKDVRNNVAKFRKKNE